MQINIYKEIVDKIENKEIKAPIILEFHPVLNNCNLRCNWCIGKSNQIKNPKYMKFNEISEFVDSIYDVDKKDFWPLEVHFCGNNSEPLLNYRFISEMCEKIKYKSVIEIVTNGILIDKIEKSLQFVDKISISLDVFCYEEFKKNKNGTRQQFMDILKNIHLIARLRQNGTIKTMLYVTFVLNNIPSDINKAYSFIKMLKEIGVNYVQFRINYFNGDRDDQKIKEFVHTLSSKLSDPEGIDYLSEDAGIFHIKYNEYGIKKQCMTCYMNSIWPIISADGKIYPCAHVANENFKNMGFKINFKKNYYQEWEKTNKNGLMCGISDKCPSMANSINYLYHCKKYMIL